MNTSLKTLASAIALGLMSSAAQAQLASEDLSVDNSTYSTAQAVGALSLSGVTEISVSGLRGSVSLFGYTFADDSKADFYSFTVAAPAVLTLSTITPSGYLSGNDTILGLFDASGYELDFNDDAYNGSSYDSLIAYNILSAGTYIAAVSGFSGKDYKFTGSTGSSNFAYTLQAEVSAIPSSVPVPAAAWLMGSALTGLGLFGRKRAA